jgi:enoyl-CoA hydratase/carnithine racemase
MSLVLRDDADGVTTLTLNRPEKLNALNPALFLELREHLEAIAGDGSVKVVVLTGAGRSFCAGNDLAAIAAGERAPSRHLQAETIDALEQLPQPTLGKVRGHCFTGGLELALGCDLIIAATSSTFGDTHGQWGMVPVWGMSVRLPERVGMQAAKRMMFTARRIDGTEAARIGLADEVVADDEFDAAVDALAAQIAASSAGTCRIVKQLLRAGANMPRAAALNFERAQPFGQPEDMAERMSRSKF